MTSEYSEYHEENLHGSQPAASLHYAQILTRQYLQGERQVYHVLRKREQNRDLRWNKILESPTQKNNNN